MKKKTIKKKQIKIPACKLGDTVPGNLSVSDGVGLSHMTLASSLPDHLQIENFTKGQKLSTNQAGAIASAAIEGLSSIANSAFGTSTATTSKLAAVQSVNDVLSNAGTGAKIGMAFGPYGALIGGAAGAVVGAIGKKGQKAKMTSFTDTYEGTLGTGLIGAFLNDDLLAERERIKQNASANRDAVRGTNYLQNEYLQKYGGMSTGTFAEGGTIPSRHVYVDDGELIKTPQGETLEVPEEGKPTDSNLVNLPVGSRILSDSLKVPGTKKTFAQLGKELMNRRTSKGTDKYAENSKMLNDRNNQQIHDELFAYQEQVKQQKGIKPKTKTVGIPAAKYGLNLPDYVEDMYWNKLPLWDTRIANQALASPGKGPGIPSSIKESNTYYDFEEFEEPQITQPSKLAINVTDSPAVDVNKIANDANKRAMTRLSKIPVQTGVTYSNIHTGGMPSKYSDLLPFDFREFEESPFSQASPVEIITTNSPAVDVDKIANDAQRNAMKGLSIAERGIQRYEKDRVKAAMAAKKAAESKNKSGKLMDALGYATDGLSKLGELSPAFMNMFEGDPEKVQANYNPYSTAITNTLGNRRYNIDKERQEILQNRALMNRNVARTNTGTGAYLAFALNSALQNNNNIANAYRYADNVNAQYAAEYADAMNNLGQQWVAETNRVQEANAANKAAARNIRRQGATQMSSWLQRNRAEKNKRNSDLAMLNLYKPFLEAGTPRENMSEFLKYYNKLSE